LVKLHFTYDISQITQDTREQKNMQRAIHVISPDHYASTLHYSLGKANKEYLTQLPYTRE